MHMKRLVTCLLFLGLVMIGCDGDDSSKECTSKCPSGQICVNGSCQTANAQDQTETDTPTGTPPDQQTGDPQDSTNPQDPPSDEGGEVNDADRAGRAGPGLADAVPGLYGGVAVRGVRTALPVRGRESGQGDGRGEGGPSAEGRCGQMRWLRRLRACLPRARTRRSRVVKMKIAI